MSTGPGAEAHTDNTAKPSVHQPRNGDYGSRVGILSAAQAALSVHPCDRFLLYFVVECTFFLKSLHVDDDGPQTCTCPPASAS